MAERRPIFAPLASLSNFGLFAGLAGFVLLVLLPAPAGLSEEGWRTAAIALLMGTWWMTEAIPIPATALLPLVLFPALGVLDMPSAAAPYANEVIFLFLGGFLLAAAMERSGLHRRMAMAIADRIGATPRRLVLGFMLATAFLSMWISNTAAAAMMLPIALAAAQLFDARNPGDSGANASNFGTALLLGIAFAASIGGVATLIGTPPNAILAGAASELLGREISFLAWMAVGVPLTVIFLPVTWFLLVHVLFPTGSLEGDVASVIRAERRALGAMSPAEKIVGVVFVATALAWIFRAPLDLGAFRIPGLASFLPGIRDSTIAIAASLVLFMIPTGGGGSGKTLTWADAQNLPWGVLLLFGGGLSLALAMDRTGLSAWIGSGVAALGFLPTVVIVASVAILFVFLTEVTSNTATATMAMPLMAGAGAAIGIDPLLLMTIAALGASMAFMLPVATPPNAVVFGSGRITIKQMALAGFALNLLSIGLITIAAFVLIPRFLGP